MIFANAVSKRNWGSLAVLFPTLCFFIFLALTLTLLSCGPRAFENMFRMLSQWDGQHYLSIARDGYTCFPCVTPPGDICGNAGWFPLYSMVGKIIAFTGLDVRAALLLVSWLSLWLSIILLYRLVQSMFDKTTAMLSCLLLLVFPTSFYFLTMFPYALYLLLALIVFTLLQAQSYRWLWIPAGLLAVTYPSGIVIGIPILCELIRRYRQLSTPNRMLLIGALTAIPLAMVIYCGYYWLKFDDFFLYSHIQATNFHHAVAFPLITIFQSLRTLPVFSAESLGLLFALAAALLFLNKRLPVGWLLYLFGILLFTPTFGSTQCYYRHIVVAFPLSVMIALAWQTKRKWLVPVYIIAAIALYAAIYLPQFKLNTLM